MDSAKNLPKKCRSVLDKYPKSDYNVLIRPISDTYGGFV